MTKTGPTRCLVGWYRLHQKCIKPASEQLAPFRPLIRPCRGGGSRKRGAQYQTPPGVGRGPLFGSVFVVSGSGPFVPPSRIFFNLDPVRDRRGL